MEKNRKLQLDKSQNLHARNVRLGMEYFEDLLKMAIEEQVKLLFGA